jgi:hypothetical protein
MYSAPVSRLVGTCICCTPGACFRVCIYNAPVARLVGTWICRTPGACFRVCIDIKDASRSACFSNAPGYAAVIIG